MSCLLMWQLRCLNTQFVDLDQPLALDFLHGDCIHVSVFFKKKGVEVITIRELFNFIIDSSITDETLGCYLEESNIRRIEREQGFVGRRYIITDQNQLPKQPKECDTNDPSTKQTNNFGTKSGKDENDEEEDDSSDSIGVEPYDTTDDGTLETLLVDKKVARKENKKKVKEEKRKARKTKTAKYVKKKKKKLSKNMKAK